MTWRRKEPRHQQQRCRVNSVLARSRVKSNIKLIVYSCVRVNDNININCALWFQFLFYCNISRLTTRAQSVNLAKIWDQTLMLARPDLYGFARSCCPLRFPFRNASCLWTNNRGDMNVVGKCVHKCGQTSALYDVIVPFLYSATIYREVCNIRRTLVGNKIVDHSDVVGVSPAGAAPTTSSFST